MSETNAQRIAFFELKSAVDNLMAVAKNNHCMVLGYVFGVEPPTFMQFANVQEQGTAFTELLLRLDEFVQKKKDTGQVEHLSPGRNEGWEN